MTASDAAELTNSNIKGELDEIYLLIKGGASKGSTSIRVSIKKTGVIPALKSNDFSVTEISNNIYEISWS
jgi:hypothetical protein